MEIIKLNLIPSGATPVVHVKQYDIGRTWRFELYEGAAVYTLDGTEVLECDVKKLDGNIVTISVTNTSSTYVDIETTVQMTACSGDQIGALRITKGSDDIGTLNFILACERSPLENGIESDSAIHNLETQIAEGVALEVANQYDSANVIFDNEPTSGHGIGYAVTSEGTKTYIDNGLNGKVDTTDFDATNLPITSGSATNTKDYIDTGLSGKASATNYPNFTKILSVATDGTTVRFIVNHNSDSAFSIFVMLLGGTLLYLGKASADSVASYNAICGSINAHSEDSTHIYLNVGNYKRATFIITSNDATGLGNISITTS